MAIDQLQHRIDFDAVDRVFAHASGPRLGESGGALQGRGDHLALGRRAALQRQQQRQGHLALAQIGVGHLTQFVFARLVVERRR